MGKFNPYLCASFRGEGPKLSGIRKQEGDCPGAISVLTPTTALKYIDPKSSIEPIRGENAEGLPRDNMLGENGVKYGIIWGEFAINPLFIIGEGAEEKLTWVEGIIIFCGWVILSSAALFIAPIGKKALFGIISWVVIWFLCCCWGIDTVFSSSILMQTFVSGTVSTFFSSSFLPSFFYKNASILQYSVCFHVSFEVATFCERFMTSFVRARIRPLSSMSSIVDL